MFLGRVHKQIADLAAQVAKLAIPGPQVDLSGVIERLGQLESDAELFMVRGDLQDAQREISARLDAVEARIKELIHAVSKGIEHTDRAERRIKSTIRRARKELADLGIEDPALEAEDAQLRLVDEPGGEQDGVQPVPEGVDRARPDTLIDKLQRLGLSR